jgi:hypothetical protein
VPHDALDRSVDSLALIDRAIARRGIRVTLDRPSRLRNARGVRGREVLRATTNGEWSLQPAAADPSILEPWVVASTGRRHPPFALVYRALAEPAEGMSIQGATAGDLVQFPSP